MTIAARPGEFWTAAEGAPQGPPFDLKAPSKSSPGLVYRIARDDSGTVFHAPGCPAFIHRRKCRHLTHALELVASPEQTFINETIKAWAHIGGAMATGDDLHAFWTATWERLGECRRMRLQQLGITVAREEWAAMTPAERTADALETFGGEAA